MPVHSHHRAQRLEPEGIAQPREKSRGAIILDDGFGDSRTQFGHSFGKPLRHAAAMERKICDARAFHVVIVTKYLPWSHLGRAIMLPCRKPRLLLFRVPVLYIAPITC